MLSVKIDNAKFKKEMNNLIEYSEGFLQGVEAGKRKFFDSLGNKVSEILSAYVDSSARVNPAALHHVYEWYQAGSPEARLFDIDYTVSNLGLSLKSSFRQSSEIRAGSYDPFVNKAKIMENGRAVTIRPKRRQFLKFEVDGQTVFSKGPITVSNPGGDAVQGSFEKTFDEFFERYFTQAFLHTSGIGQYLENPTAYKKDLPKAKRGGKAQGITTGYRWIVNAGIR